MKLFRKLAALVASASLIFGLAVPCFASDDVYYAQNGLVGRPDGTGMQMYEVAKNSGYDQMVTVYVLCEKKCYDYKTFIYFPGIADCDPDWEQKSESKSYDYFKTPFYPMNMDYEEDWDNNGAAIYSFTISLAAGYYSFIGGGTDGYYAKFDPISPTFENYYEENDWSGFDDYDNKKYFLPLLKGGTARTYGIFFMDTDKTGGHSTFYDDNIDEFIEWAIAKERSILAAEEETDRVLGKTEEISVSVSQEDVLDAFEEKLETVEKPNVEVIEEPEEFTAVPEATPEKKKFPIGLAAGCGGLVVVIVAILIIFRRRR